MYGYLREFFTCFIFNDRHNYAYILLVWNFETLGILPAIITYGDGSHKYICTCYQIQ